MTNKTEIPIEHPSSLNYHPHDPSRRRPARSRHLRIHDPRGPRVPHHPRKKPKNGFSAHDHLTPPPNSNNGMLHPAPESSTPEHDPPTAPHHARLPTFPPTVPNKTNLHLPSTSTQSLLRPHEDRHAPVRGHGDVHAGASVTPAADLLEFDADDDLLGDLLVYGREVEGRDAAVAHARAETDPVHDELEFQHATVRERPRVQLDAAALVRRVLPPVREERDLQLGTRGRLRFISGREIMFERKKWEQTTAESEWERRFNCYLDAVKS